MTRAVPTFILGSRSPRRLELLGRIVPADRIAVRAPRDPDEPGFDGLHDWPAIEARLTDVAVRKWNDVRRQIEADGAGTDRPAPVIIAADTIIVVRESSERLLVLGQPPAGPNWPETVRRWFVDYYAGRTHLAATALCVGRPAEKPLVKVVRSQVDFHADVERQLEWYLATQEPLGKAGGYALQGAGSLFVSRVEGSLSNVVGLPLRELWDALDELGVDV